MDKIGDTTKNAPAGLGDTANSVSKPDAAKGDVTGGRKPGAPTAGGAPGGTVEDGEKKNSLRINIELDIYVEIQLTARVKGDITIGLL